MPPRRMQQALGNLATALGKMGRGTVRHPRTANYLRQVKGAAVYKALAILASLLLVRAMVQYLGPAEYGVWATLFSMTSWMTFFDLGLADSTRNKVAEALARGDIKDARVYISVTYVYIAGLSIVLFLAILAASGHIRWQSVFNTRTVSEDDLCGTVLIVSAFVLLNFVLSIVNRLLYAIQLSSLVVLGQLLSNVFACVLVVGLSLLGAPELTRLALAYGVALLGSNVVLTVVFYRRQPELVPSLRLFDLRRVGSLFSLGIRFFAINVSALVILSTSRLVITQLFGPEEVTPYDVVVRLFGAITIVHSIVLAPLWSTFTECYVKGDFAWIRGVIRRLTWLMVPFGGAALILAFCAPSIVRLWIGADVHLSYSLALVAALFTLTGLWTNIFAQFANGMNAINPQAITAVLGGLINVPLCVFLARNVSMGTGGVLLGATISLGLFAVVGPIQAHLLLRRAMSHGSESGEGPI